MPEDITTYKTLDIYRLWDNSMDIMEFKKWIDAKIKEGKTKVSIEIGWGFYDLINSLELTVK